MAPKTNPPTRARRGNTPAPAKQPKPKRVPRPGRKLHPKLDFHYLAALTNPFSRVATGAKIPSIVPLGTTTQKIHLRGTVFTDSSGTALVTVSPNPLVGLRAWPFSAGALAVTGAPPPGGDVISVQDPGGNQHNSLAVPIATIASLSRFRVVSFGVKVASATSDSNNGGICSYGTDFLGTSLRRWYIGSGAVVAAPAFVSATADANYNYGDAYADVFGEMGLGDASGLVSVLDINQVTPHRVPIEALRTKSRIVVGTPVDDAHPFCDLNCVAPAVGQGPQGRPEWDRTWSNMDHKSVILHVSGAAVSASVLEVEIIYHLEHFDPPRKNAGGLVGPISQPANSQPGSKEYTRSVAATQPQHFIEDSEAAAGGAALALAAPEAAGAVGGLWGALTSFGSGLATDAVAALPSLLEAAPLLLL